MSTAKIQHLQKDLFLSRFEILEDALQMKINFLYCCLGELGENVHLDGASGAYNGLAPIQCRSQVWHCCLLWLPPMPTTMHSPCDS